MKKSMKHVFILAALVLSAALAGCGQQAAVKPTPTAQTNATPTFAGTNIAPQMKIYGTGCNFAGIAQGRAGSAGAQDAREAGATNGSGWTSDGPAPHWLILDGSGTFDTLILDNLKGATSIQVEVLNKGQLVKQIKVTGKSISNRMDFAFSNIPGSRIRIRFEGEDVLLGRLILTGKYDGKGDYSVAKEFKMAADEKTLLQQANQYTLAGDWNRAIEEYQKIAAKYPENPLVYQNLGQAYIARSDKHETPEDNTADLRSAMESWAAANRPENPDRLGLLERMALVYQNQLLDQEKSAALWKEYIAVAETNGLVDGDKLASALVAGITTTKVGFDPVFEEKMEKVADLLRQGKVSAGNFDAYMWLVRYTSYLIKDRKNYTNARDISAIVVKTFPEFEQKENANAHFNLALANMTLKRWEEAIEAWKGYLDGTPNIRGAGEACISYVYNTKLTNKNMSYKWYKAYLHRINFISSNMNYVTDVFSNVNKPYLESKRKEGRISLKTWEFEENLVDKYELYFDKYNINILSPNEANVIVESIALSFLNKTN